MNDEGEMHKDLLTKTMTVINLGAGTTIMDTFKSLKRLPDKSETFYEGMNDVHRKIRNKLERDHNIKGLNTSFIDNGLRRGDFIAEISGVNIVGKEFREKFNEENVVLVKSSQTANLEGFFKLAKTLAS